MVLTSVLARSALACGGFFCSAFPVDQAGEDVLFAVDADAGTVTLHVEVAYEGPAESFAWVIPVPAEPVVGLSNGLLFRNLNARTPATFRSTMDQSDCQIENYLPTGPNPLLPPAPSVEVITSDVGPYEVATLRARNPADLISWLTQNGYDLPPEVDKVLAPYVSDDGWFVALKLAKGEPVGALQPLALTWPGSGMSIPMQITAIAAVEDMPVRVHVLGPHRAVPDSYVHAVLDDLHMDWWSLHEPGFVAPPIAEVIQQAVDEAGGRAFVTGFAGPSTVMANVLWSPGQYNTAGVRAATPDTVMDDLLGLGLPLDTPLVSLLQVYFPMPQAVADGGVAPVSYYACLDCFLPSEAIAALALDAPGLAAAIDERLVAPLIEAQGLFDRIPWLTRMATTVSPADMQLDPTFVFNADLPQEVGAHSASVWFDCTDRPDYSLSNQQHSNEYTANMSVFAPVVLELADGRTYWLPSMVAMQESGTGPFQLMAPLLDRAAIRIEDLSATGPGVVLADYTPEAFREANLWNMNNTMSLAMSAEVAAVPGCGCAQPAGLSWLGCGVLGVLWRRRRLS